MSIYSTTDLRIRIEGDAQEFGPDNRKFILEVVGDGIEFDLTPLVVKEEYSEMDEPR